MKYNFDRIIDRRGSDSVKYDLLNPVFGRDDILPMWVADMDFEVPDFIRRAIKERAEHPVYGYTFRPERFYRNVSEWIERRHQWSIPHDMISFSPGVVPALNLCIMAFSKPGDRILVQPPVYFPFFSAVKNHNRKLTYNQLIEEEGVYRIDFEDLEKKFSAGVRMMLFCHPHNPVGRVWKKEELERLASLAIQYDVLMVSDEIHHDLTLFKNRHIPLAASNEEIAMRTITCVAPSKTFNLAGLYSSALIFPDPKLKEKYDKMLDRIHVGAGNLFGMVAMEAAYSLGDEWLDQLIVYLEKNFLFLKDFLGSEIPDLTVSPLEATYLAWLDFSFLGLKNRVLRKFIVDEAKLGLNDGLMFGPGGEGHQRLNIAAPRKILEKALNQLAGAVKRLYI